MKKLILVLATLGTCYTGFGQDIVVESALTDLSHNNLDAAKENIDRAMSYPGTKEKPKALYAKYRIYMELQVEKIPKYIESHPYREAAQALMKLAEVKPDYEKAAVDLGLYNCAIFYNNDGVMAFNNNKPKEGIECMLNVVKIHDLNGGKRYEKYALDKYPVKKFDTMAANANSSAAIRYFLDSNYANAVPLLEKVVANPITKIASNYNLLVEAYGKINKDKEVVETIEAGRKLFPNDKTLRNNELYYYFKAGKMDELIKKLEDAAAAEPDNAEMQFNLAITYLDMINTKDETKKVNVPEVTKKAEAAFTKALAKSPDNANYNYNFGVLYYDQGKDINEKMNALADKINDKAGKNVKDDQKQYDAMKAERGAQFGKSLTYFEKAYNQLSPKAGTLSKEEKNLYKNCLAALKDTYTVLEKNDKYNEVKAKLDAME